jgi:hypothetical protein
VCVCVNKSRVLGEPKLRRSKNAHILTRATRASHGAYCLSRCYYSVQEPTAPRELFRTIISAAGYRRRVTKRSHFPSIPSLQIDQHTRHTCPERVIRRVLRDGWRRNNVFVVVPWRVPSRRGAFDGRTLKNVYAYQSGIGRKYEKSTSRGFCCTSYGFCVHRSFGFTFCWLH